MAGAQSVWGLDMGRSALKAIKLRPAADGKVEIVGYDYIEHAKILSQPDADRHALIGSALEKFLSRNDISKDQVVVSVPGQHTLARFTKLPPVAPKRIPDIVRYEADQQIPFDMDEVIWDYQTFQQEGMPDVEVGIFAMKRELIREHLLHFEQAAIEPIAVQSGPLAVYNAAHFEGLIGDETTIIVDIGAENTDLIIATKESLWTRTVPIGGNSFTEALVKSFKLSFSKAESLKRTAASSKYARQVFQAMRPIFADLVQELQRSIGFYSSTHRDANVVKLVALGNAFRLPGLHKYLQQNLGLAVEKVESFRNANISAPPKEESLTEQFLSFSVAYGLALQGMDLTKVTSNLLPTEIAKQVVWRKKRPAFAAAAACILVAGGLVWFRQYADTQALAAGASGAELVKVNDVEEAAAIINNGPSGSLSDRAKAKTVYEAANFLKREAERLGNEGGPERAATEKLIELQKNKVVVPGILKAIHASVPQPDGFAEVDDPEAIRSAAEQGKLPPRKDRKQLRLESVDTVFEPDLRFTNWKPMVAAQPALNSYDPESGDPLPGLLVKIACTTPNTGGAAFVNESFVDVLRKNGRQKGLGFYFDQVILAAGEKWNPEADSARGAPGGLRGGARPPGATSDTKMIDVVTNEPRNDDWRFDVWASVIVGELPEEPAEEAPAEGEGEEAPADGEKP